MAPEVWRWYKNRWKIAQLAQQHRPCVLAISCAFSVLFVCMGGAIAYFSNPTQKWAAFYTGLSVPYILAVSGSKASQVELQNAEYKAALQEIEEKTTSLISVRRAHKKSMQGQGTAYDHKDEDLEKALQHYLWSLDKLLEEIPRRVVREERRRIRPEVPEDRAAEASLPAGSQGIGGVTISTIPIILRMLRDMASVLCEQFKLFNRALL